MLGLFIEAGKMRRQGRADAGRGLDRVGEFGGVRGAEEDERRSRPAQLGLAPRRTEADGRMRIGEIARLVGMSREEVIATARADAEYLLLAPEPA